MRQIGLGLALGLAAAVAAGAARAADFSDPTWPCIQRKVADLSPGLMWPRPLAEVELAPEVSRAVEDLAERLTLRRLPVEEVRPAVEAFVAEHGAAPELLGQVFQRAFDRLDRDRRAIVQGIGDYSLSQIDRAERIDAARGEMTAEMAKAEPDFDRVDALEEQVAWEERIYADRQQSLTYVCETPVLLERRLYEIARLLDGLVEE